MPPSPDPSLSSRFSAKGLRPGRNSEGECRRWPAGRHRSSSSSSWPHRLGFWPGQLFLLAYFPDSPRSDPAPVGRELAGLTREGLDELLADLPRKVLLQLEDQAWEAAPEDFGFQIDGDLTRQRASLAGRGGKVAAALLGKSATILEPVVAFDEEALDAWLQSLAGEAYRRPQNPSLGPAGELIPGEEGRRLDLAEAKSSILAEWLGRGPGTLALPLEKLAPQTTTADLEPFRGGCKLASFRTSLGPSDPQSGP